MSENKATANRSKKRIRSIRVASEESIRLPFQVSRSVDQISEMADAQRINQNKLVNTINHLHFTDQHVYVYFRHPKYKDDLMLKVFPYPCLGERLTCRWSERRNTIFELESYQFLGLIIGDGLSMIMSPAELMEMTTDLLIMRLPNISFLLGKRRARRYSCENIQVELSQSGFQAGGVLLDFSPDAFRIRAKPESGASFHWLNTHEMAHIYLKRDKDIFFSGLCRCIRHKDHSPDREMVLVSVDTAISRFRKRKLRNRRESLTPAPVLIFDHPFLNKRVQFEILNISTSGFSVFENAENGVLLPGMIISELTISFAGAFKIKCISQVIYRNEKDDENTRCGLTVLDMDITNYSRLADVLINSMDPNAHVAKEVDIDDMWRFLFDTGFIYPEKYFIVHSFRKELKKTFQKLYQENLPEIERHFTYQRNGQIYGHLSMVRAYERSWLLQNFAAKSLDKIGPGFKVLRQIVYFLDDGRRLPSTKLDYLLAYFRPENKFPERVFGGFARSLDNPKGCSMDSFAYLHHVKEAESVNLPENWRLTSFSNSNLATLKRFYHHASDGILLDALCLEKNGDNEESVEELYLKFGLMRKHVIFSLSQGNDLHAVLMVNQSSAGINLSDLLNAITVIVINSDSLPWNILNKGIAQLAGLYESLSQVPVLISPMDYVQNKNIPYERQYLLWILNLRYGGEFTEYMKNRFKVAY
ncbi:hypothetical protein ACFLZM_01475 [Thermodesulfobacteriota bacterium]